MGVFPALSSSLFQPYFLSGTTYVQIQFRVTQRRNYGNAPGKRGSDFVSSLWRRMGERNFGEKDTKHVYKRKRHFIQLWKHESLWCFCTYTLQEKEGENCSWKKFCQAFYSTAEGMLYSWSKNNLATLLQQQKMNREEKSDFITRKSGCRHFVILRRDSLNALNRHSYFEHVTRR